MIIFNRTIAAVHSGTMLIVASILLIMQVTWVSAHQTSCENKGPFCGNDGKTYATMCKLIWGRIYDPDLQVLHDGTCTGHAYKGELSPNEVLKTHNPGNKPKQAHQKTKNLIPPGWPPLGPLESHVEKKKN
ncbi:uncharacterized protein LOC118267341 [Spodoptera frugiperda]|uniref:Uncharacterized protein LOC118267341 n=1 Tax=Spodoptera frugiperda TaxID=7108 RepID=A0A9R0EJ44_SPOFR|nr:uncharacterized protein LOC118267341 [Spodoptera frugiperda]